MHPQGCYNGIGTAVGAATIRGSGTNLVLGLNERSPYFPIPGKSKPPTNRRTGAAPDNSTTNIFWYHHPTLKALVYREIENLFYSYYLPTPTLQADLPPMAGRVDWV